MTNTGDDQGFLSRGTKNKPVDENWKKKKKTRGRRALVEHHRGNEGGEESKMKNQ